MYLYKKLSFLYYKWRKWGLERITYIASKQRVEIWTLNSKFIITRHTVPSSDAPTATPNASFFPVVHIKGKEMW